MLIAGAFLLLLGLASGLFLFLGALGALPAAPGLSLWLLYPILSIVGFLLVALASRTAHLGSLTRLASVAGPNYGALGQTFSLGASELP